MFGRPDGSVSILHLSSQVARAFLDSTIIVLKQGKITGLLTIGILFSVLLVLKLWIDLALGTLAIHP